MSTRNWEFAKPIRENIPTIGVLLVLMAVAGWGIRNEWRIPGLSSPAAEKDSEGQESSRPSGSSATVIAPTTPNPQQKFALDGFRIKFPSAEAVRQAGIQVLALEARPLKATIDAPAEIAYDPTLMSRLTTPVVGRAWQVRAEVGQRVAKGDILALLDSAEVGKAKADFLQALTERELRITRIASLKVAGEGVAGRQLQEAEAAARDARIRLFNAEQLLINLGIPVKAQQVATLSDEQLTSRIRFLGLPDSIVAELDPELATSNLLPVKAPFDGLIVDRSISTGEVVDVSKDLFVVADISRVWLIISVRQEDADALAMDQPVTFLPDGHPEEVVNSSVSWVSTTIDEKTRAMRVRAVVENPQEHYRAGTFGAAKITIRDEPLAIVVPQQAVQREGTFYFAFVALPENVFQVRQVELGVHAEDGTEVVAGLKASEQVVTTGSFILKSELLKGRLGDDE